MYLIQVLVLLQFIIIIQGRLLFDLNEYLQILNKNNRVPGISFGNSQMLNTTENKFGDPNSAVYFNGMGDCIELDGDIFYYLDIQGYTYLTIQVNIYISTYGQIIFDNNFAFDTREYGYMFGISYQGYLYWASGDGTNRCDILKIKQNSCYCISSKKVPQNKWVNVAVTKDLKKVSFYIEGEQVGSDQQLGASSIKYSENHPKYIGKVQDSFFYQDNYFEFNKKQWDLPWVQFFEGSLSDLQIFNSVLNSKEIIENIHVGGNANCLQYLYENDVKTCIKCRANRILDKSSNQCIIQKGYYQNQDTLEILKCQQGCSICQSPNDCQLCDGENRIWQNKCVCKLGFSNIEDTGNCYE